MLSSTLLLGYGYKIGGVWTLETADPTPQSCYYASLHLDADDNPAISYVDGRTNYNDLRFAWKEAGVWMSETADGTSITVSNLTSLAFDPSGVPHICYHDYYGGKLRHTSKTGGVWSREIVDGAGSGVFGRYASLALDSDGNPHVVHQDASRGIARHVTRAGGAWSVEELPSTGFLGAYASLAIDGNDALHVSYRDEEFDRLEYARKEAGAWARQTVDATPGIDPQYTSLALDPTNRPHVCYFDAAKADLHYARKIVGGWIRETADSTGNTGVQPSLEIDTGGNPHVVYAAAYQAGVALRYARRSAFIWYRENVDGGASAVRGSYSSLALDAQGNLYVSYLDFTNADLRYACKVGGSWVVETVDQNHEDGLYTSIALDPEANVHITYYDATVADLKHAVRTGSTWLIEVVDGTSSAVGRFSSLAIDAQGNLHIAYEDSAAADLKYATASTITSVFNSHGAARRLWVTPNPAVDGFTRIALEGHVALGPIELAVFDASGRRVRRLIDNATSTGRETIAWDGRDDLGRSVAGGVYFIRLTAPTVEPLSQRVVLVR